MILFLFGLGGGRTTPRVTFKPNGGPWGGLATTLSHINFFKKNCLIGPYGCLDFFCHSLSSFLPQLMERLHEVGPPPILTKTFEMVEDPSTNSIVSWSGARIIFIVWDLNKLSTIILPRHFKHNNFSIFIHKLNTYASTPSFEKENCSPSNRSTIPNQNKLSKPNKKPNQKIQPF